AVAALRSGKSLLPAGVIQVDGSFARGDAVIIRGPDGAEVGRGLVAYDAQDAAKIKGRPSADILSILGFGGRTAMGHRDDLVGGGPYVIARVPPRGKSRTETRGLCLEEEARAFSPVSCCPLPEKEDPGQKGQGLSPDG